ncbi:amidase family protein [Kitasatospora purpeofusca]|uniref:amidase family protein n=1 Tax=Kitasatospora purpeofusca TaxID=67352 RepID=UPI0036E0C477
MKVPDVAVEMGPVGVPGVGRHPAGTVARAHIGAWRAGTGGDPPAALRNGCPMGVVTPLFNVTGQPAVSMPVHHDDATGLPVGVQLVAAPRREDLLLQVSRTLEPAHPWADRRPPGLG